VRRFEMQTIIMRKSLSPSEIPNGSIGKIISGDIRRPGLAMAVFCEYVLFVYPNEVVEMLPHTPEIGKAKALVKTLDIT